jgi:hypothetical protein
MLSRLDRQSLEKSLDQRSLPPETRWALAGQESLPKDEWHSFDRTPWLHPWMSADNIRRFAAFSNLELTRLEAELDAHRRKTFLRRGIRGLCLKWKKASRYAFVGNMANVNYVRAIPLRRRKLDVDLVLYPYDDFIFAQPAWEDFDGEITDLGENPGAKFFLWNPTGVRFY